MEGLYQLRYLLKKTMEHSTDSFPVVLKTTVDIPKVGISLRDVNPDIDGRLKLIFPVNASSSPSPSVAVGAMLSEHEARYET